MREDYQNAVNRNFDVQNTQGVKIDAKADDRLDENYTCKDQNWRTGTFQGDIYISTPDDTHNLIVAHHNDTRIELPEDKYPGTSGFFTNEETASKHFAEAGKFDSIGLGHDLQQAPYFDTDKANEAKINETQYIPEYNGHLDCFRVNPEKMQEHYGTVDFYAATSQCKENTAWGEGGGFQGYNPYINDMINKGALEYVPEKSRICENNNCTDYAERKGQALDEAQAVNKHIEDKNIQGKPGEKLGYNELPQSSKISETASNSTESSKPTSMDKVSDGGGARAPNSELRGHTDNPDNSVKTNTPVQRGNTDNGPINASDNTHTAQVRGNNINEPTNNNANIPTDNDLSSKSALSATTGGSNKPNGFNM